MSQQLYGLSKTFIVSGTTVTSGRVVKYTGTAVTIYDTITAIPLGVSMEQADPSTTVEVMLFGTVKAVANTACSAGDVVVPATNGSVETKAATAYTHTSGQKAIGIALETVTNTGATIEILLRPEGGVQA